MLTLQAFTDLHPKPSPIHGSVKDIFTETFEELVKVVEAVTYAVGGIVSEKVKNDFYHYKDTKACKRPNSSAITD